MSIPLRAKRDKTEGFDLLVVADEKLSAPQLDLLVVCVRIPGMGRFPLDEQLKPDEVGVRGDRGRVVHVRAVQPLGVGGFLTGPGRGRVAVVGRANVRHVRPFRISKAGELIRVERLRRQGD